MNSPRKITRNTGRYGQQPRFERDASRSKTLESGSTLGLQIAQSRSEFLCSWPQGSYFKYRYASYVYTHIICIYICIYIYTHI